MKFYELYIVVIISSKTRASKLGNKTSKGAVYSAGQAYLGLTIRRFVLVLLEIILPSREADDKAGLDHL